MAGPRTGGGRYREGIDTRRGSITGRNSQYGASVISERYGGRIERASYSSGKPEHDNDTVSLTPLTALSNKLYVADCPGIVTSLAGDALTLKLATFKVRATECCVGPDVAATVIVYFPIPSVPTVLRFSIDVAEPVRKSTEAGLNKQEAPVGKPEHDNDTALLKPFCDFMLAM